MASIRLGIYLNMITLLLAGSVAAQEQSEVLGRNLSFTIWLKQAGNPAEAYPLRASGENLIAERKLPLTLRREIIPDGEEATLRIEIEALQDVNMHLQGQVALPGVDYDTAYLFLPGFWYRKNLRSPDEAPSARVSTDWIVREDRLSAPLTALFDRGNERSYALTRLDTHAQHSLAPLNEGEVLLSGPFGLFGGGFGAADDGSSYLAFAYPYAEAPHSYYRKLELGEPVMAFLQLAKGEKRTLTYRWTTFAANDYSDFMRRMWTRSYDRFAPKPLTTNQLTDEEVKEVLSNFYRESFITVGDLKGFSGVFLEVDQCERRKLLEVGFVGRVLLNAFNALEFAEQRSDDSLKHIAYEVLNSYEQHGITPEGFIKELVDMENNFIETTYSIRRQSEGLYAILLYLRYELDRDRLHPQWEKHTRKLLEQILTLQRADGSFPRKFKGDLTLVDTTGGSSPSAVLPLVMGYRYFGDERYLQAARKVANYLESEIISKADYFSSTLDANCEDKEASIYAATALYYLALVTDPASAEYKRYVNLASQAAYFALSWYYLWDVPFAEGQMLGELGLKTRGWGNVSVENNHIDVFIFELNEVLKWLSTETGDQRLADYTEVIRSSMREQLLPYPGHMVGIAKVGYYPEVVQHTQWDYGHYGKGFYNLHFAPGWTVPSLWELLTDGRVSAYLSGKARPVEKIKD